MSTFTDKELIKEIKERIGSLDVRDNIERRAYEIALASLEAEPVAWMRDDADGREYNARNEFSGGGRSSTLRHPSSASSTGRKTNA